MRLFGGRKQDEALAQREEEVQKLEEECRTLRTSLADTRELVRHLDQDRELLLEALRRVRPGMDLQGQAQVILDLSFKPMALACFFVAVADWERDQLRFALYHEGGRFRNHPSRRISDRMGLSERVLTGRRPVYIRTLEEGQAAGSLLTAAELATGLIPHSWYGIPLGLGDRPSGLVSFQSFQTDAFSEGRRRVLDGLAALLSTCMETPPQAGQAP
jgi:hypothetical protein